MTSDADMVGLAEANRLRAIADGLFQQLVRRVNASGQLLQFAGVLAQPEGLDIIRDTCVLMALRESGDFDDLIQDIDADIAANLERLGVRYAA